MALDSSAGITAGGSRGLLFVAGDPETSLLLRAVRYDDPDLQMPPEGRLSDVQIRRVEEWVRRAAPMPVHGPVTQASQRAIDIEAGREFWSFRPLVKHAAPDPTDDAWSQGPIDRFVLERLRTAGLTPRDEADRRTLIRRASFDLLGLPPTPAEIDDFLADDSPDAYERLIDRLIASPHYGERWGRHWLDLARYSDETPDWQSPTNLGWRYRDWVIASLNDDLGYDDFARRQLAADLYEDRPPQDLAALGFLGLAPTYWKELRLAPAVIKQVVADEWDERIDAVSRTFLGLTVSCARCHDHKFDPVTMEDYYALAGVFASAQISDRPVLPPRDAKPLMDIKHQIDGLKAELAKITDKSSEPAKALQAQIDELRQSPGYDVQWVHAVEEASIYVLPDGPNATRLESRPAETRDLQVFKRGNPTNLGDVVPRRFIEVLTRRDTQAFSHGSGRGELAEWTWEHSETKAARDIVKRVWRHHFGEGIVRTPSDFGAQGELPTHAGLLDWLAARFVDEGWSLKWLHREILLSAVWRQSSVWSPDAAAIDPENRLLWRMNPQRLEVEAWRDAMLSATGELNKTMGGPADDLADAAAARRTIYGKVRREDLDSMLRLYDFPEPAAHSPKRETTTTPLQQLFVLNSPLVTRQGELLAERVLSEHPDDPTRIGAVFELLYGRLPDASEVALLLEALDTAPGAADADRWAGMMHVLLGANEFQFVD